MLEALWKPTEGSSAFQVSVDLPDHGRNVYLPDMVYLVL